LDRNEVTSFCPVFPRLSELASTLVLLVDLLQTVSATLLDSPFLCEDVDEILGFDRGEVIGGLVCPPALENLKDENTRGSVECQCDFI